MDFLRKERLEKWRAAQPADVAAATQDPVSSDPAFAALVASRLPTFTSASAVTQFVSAHPEEFIALGRAGRLRFLAWVFAKKYPDINDFTFQLISEKEVEEGEGGEGSAGEQGLDRVTPYFYSDLLAFAEAIGPRVAALIVDSNTLDAVAGAGLEMTSEFEMKGGM